MTEIDIITMCKKLDLLEKLGMFDSMFSKTDYESERIISSHKNDKLSVKCAKCGGTIIRLNTSKCAKCGGRNMILYDMHE